MAETTIDDLLDEIISLLGGDLESLDEGEMESLRNEFAPALDRVAARLKEELDGEP